MINQFESLLKKSLLKLPKEDLALAFSGGLDSSVIAKLLLDLNFNFKAYVAGLKDSRDIRQARKVAHELNLSLEVIELFKEDIEKAVPQQYLILKQLYEKSPDKRFDPNPIPISFNLPLFFVAKHAKEKNLVLAQGSDEMLGGYTRHSQLGKKKAEAEMKSNIKDFMQFGRKQNEATLHYFDKKAFFPFLEGEIIDFCLSLPYSSKIHNGIRKKILRDLAISLGLKNETAMQVKKAAQYGSGIIWEMKRLAKLKNMHISRYVKESIA